MNYLVTLGPYQEEPVSIRMSAFEAFKRIYPFAKHVFLLESLGEDLPAGRQEGKYNRFSYVGFDPVSHIVAKNGELFIDGRLVKTNDPYKYLEEMFPIDKHNNGFSGGLVGYVSHEGTRYFEPAFTPLPNGEFPDFEFGLYQDGLIFDKKTKKIVYFHHGINRLSKLLSYLHGQGTLGEFDYKLINCGKTKEQHRKMVNKALEYIRAGD